jgi:hypothetical protein
MDAVGLANTDENSPGSKLAYDNLGSYEQSDLQPATNEPD